MEEASGNRVDLVNGLVLVPSDAITAATGINGDALNCPAAARTLNCSHNAVLNIPALTGMTISFFVNAPTGPAANNFALWKGAADESTVEYYFNSSGPSNNTYGFFIDVIADEGWTEETAYTINEAYTGGTWHLVIVWWDPADGKVHASIDGGATSDGTGSITPWASTEGLHLKAGNSATGELLFDELGIWSRVLSSDERTELYNSGTGKFYPFS